MKTPWHLSYNLQTLRRFTLGVTLACLVSPALVAQPVQTRLDKQVRIIVAYAAGSASDSITRFIADNLSKHSGVPVIVENRPGADGNIAAEAAARMTASESYTLLFAGSSTHAANATLYKKLPFDPQADFTPLATAASTPYVLLVNPRRVPAANLDTFLAWARQQEISFASANVGGRISGELFKQRTRLNAVNVSYKASSQAMLDLLGGEFDYYFCDMVTALPQIQAGTVRALAISSPARVPSLPDTPTLAESGFPGFDVSSWVALWSANASTPQSVATRLSAWIGQILASPEGRNFLSSKGLLPAEDVSPDHLKFIQQRDTKALGDVIIAAGMQQP